MEPIFVMDDTTSHLDGDSLIVVGNAHEDRLVFVNRRPTDKSLIWESYTIEIRFPETVYAIHVTGDDLVTTPLAEVLRHAVASPTRHGQWKWGNPMADVAVEIEADGSGHYLVRVQPHGDREEHRLYVSAQLRFDWASLDRFARLLAAFMGRSLTNEDIERGVR